MAQAGAPGPFRLTGACVSCYDDTMSTPTQRLRTAKVTIEFEFAFVAAAEDELGNVPRAARRELKNALRDLDPADYADVEVMLAANEDYQTPDGQTDDDIVYGSYDGKGNPVRWRDAVAADRVIANQILAGAHVVATDVEVES